MSLLGTTVGHIRILESVGRGGMGEVYVGLDQKLERKVALKALREEFRLDEEAKSRFLREARALSHLRHPNICLIHDYLETEDSDYLVLELVEGRTLTEVIRAGVPERQSLDIAGQLAGVLVAAHAEGIIHRDLKPGNVMITPAGQVKVLDFGLARSLDEEEASTLLFPSASSEIEEPSRDASKSDGQTSYVKTRHGAVIGTPGYMSPEQARGEYATPASDMYSFGLVLHELFSCEPPYGRGLTRAEQLRRVREAETEPLARRLDVDLTTLIRRLKSRQPGARPSAQDAADRLRWIRRKPQRRLRRLLTVAAFAFLLMVIALVGYQAIRISREVERTDREAARANREAETAERVSEFLVGLFEVSDPSQAKGSSITAREILDDGSRRLDTELAGQPEIRARLKATLGDVYTGLGEYEAAARHLEEAVETLADVLGVDDLDTVRARHSLANLRWYQGRYRDAEELYRAVVATRERLLGSEHPETLRARYDLASAILMQGRYEEFEATSNEILEAQSRVLGPEHPDTLATLNNLASLFDREGRYDEAAQVLARVLEGQRRALGGDHPLTLRTLHNLAMVYRSLGRYADAESLLREALERGRRVLGAGHPVGAITEKQLGVLYYEHLGRFEEAEGHLLAARDALVDSFGPDDERTLDVVERLLGLYEAWGKPEKAAEYRALLEGAAPPSD